MVEMSIIYAACVAGAIGLLFLLPRRGNRWGLIGAILGAGALGAGMLAMARGAATSADHPDVFFYVLSFIAIAGAVRLISNPRPVYAVLYFILVVLATAGLFVQLGAEFMAFALIIVYAGAILITYLFVIMLAQEAPEETHAEALLEYDASAREPVAATIIGFVLLAALLGVMYRGTSELPYHPAHHGPADAELAMLVGAAQTALRDADLMRSDESIVSADPATRTALVHSAPSQTTRLVAWPAGLHVDNVDAVGISLLAEFPVSLEVAGVILMLAMLGAVVLARKERVDAGVDAPHDSQSLIVGVGATSAGATSAGAST